MSDFFSLHPEWHSFKVNTSPVYQRLEITETLRPCALLVSPDPSRMLDFAVRVRMQLPSSGATGLDCAPKRYHRFPALGLIMHSQK